jgi:PKD repeat protein
MRNYLLTLMFACVAFPLYAEHIKGGEMFYEYLPASSTATMSAYQVTLKLYIDCNANSSGQLDNFIGFTIFDKGNNLQYGDTVKADMTQEQFIKFDPASNPCISNPPTDVCYRIRWYSHIVMLPVNASGYIISYQRCCRIVNIINLQAPSNAVGATYMCEIPGTNVLPEGYKNSSPRFVTNDATAICRNSNFTLSFAAEKEPDGTDSLVYTFCSGFIGASQGQPNPKAASSPPYNSLNYKSPYNGNSPLGGQVTIDPKTGLISGIAPAAVGQYVITVCAYEYRQGLLINIHRKDIHVKVSDCIPLQALLKPNYAYCDDFLVTFRNEQVNPAGSVYIWNYGDGTKPDTTTDIEGHVQHQYADTGTYQIKLKVILAGQCEDETVTLAKVYPGFYPGFKVLGTCVLLPLQFADTSTSKYGAPNKWRWNFGDETSTADTSHLQNPSWKYSTIGIKQVELIVESDKGCVDTVTASTEVRDKPPINFPFKDTLICSIDTLQLQALGNGIFSWTPPYNILNENTATPLVWPKKTTYYTVTLNENGCINKDSMRVRVVDFVTLFAGNDSTICLTDTIQLKPITDGLKFEWSGNVPGYISNANVKQPFVKPSATTTYHVVAHIGKCSNAGDVTIRTVPYPMARVSADTLICYEDTASIQGSMNGSSFRWSPTSTLSSPNSLRTLAWPRKTTSYILSAYDTLGCPKPGRDTVVVTVKDEIIAFAGRDTSVVTGQPLQLHATGSDFFEWQPPTYLNRNDVANPIAILNDNFTYQLKAYSAEGCFDMDTINIKVFKTSPDVFVPNAFHPGASRNNVLRPIPVGISTLEFFRVYDRWGQLVFQTFTAEIGWDGTVGGKPQDTGTYVWVVRGKDYTGKTVMKRGFAVLLR